jgi:hypothetical protein
MHYILVYSTDYHLRQIELIDGILAEKFRIGFKGHSLFSRLNILIKCFYKLIFQYRKNHIYIPRFASKDNWLIYIIFHRRCTLISDGITDFLPNLSIFKIGFLNLCFKMPVKSEFSVLNNKFNRRDIYYDCANSVAIFNKRGRDPDYVMDYVIRNKSTDVIVNPSKGFFSHIYSAPSTVLFEVPSEMKPYITIISQKHCSSIKSKRRELLVAYEKALSDIGYRVI